MNASRPILIPTPREMRLLRGLPKRVQTGTSCRIMASAEPRVAFAVEALQRHLADRATVQAHSLALSDEALRDAAPTDIVLCADSDPRATALLPEPLRTLDGPNAEQGYVIHSDNRTPVVLYARSSVGLLHAVATLLQLIESPDRDGYELPGISIRDCPAFAIRGNNWNLFGEIGGWSYDRGDGREAYEQRIVRKLDLCWQHKINLVIFDGLGWNTDRSPGYAPMMQRLNQAARLRGVRLLYSGYGSGYGARCNSGESFRNRSHYPDGPVYPCFGCPTADGGDIARTMGSCLSNPDLLQLKQRELTEFVQRVEPGALYIHNLDISHISEALIAWPLRCPACRKRWPNDAIAAPDGMAGAYAWFYDALADAINQVVNPASDYHADRDCLLFMVSPNYSSYDADDREWQAHCDYFEVLSGELRNRNIVLGLREQFCNQDGVGGRYAQLRQHLDRAERGTAFGGFCFLGGDGYYNNLPFVATPALAGCFAGADAIVHASGNGLHEPQQLLNAEYGWNPRGSAFHIEKAQTDHAAFMRRYWRLLSGRARPAKLFAPGGFLDQACCRLYGEKAGPRMAEVYRLSGSRPIQGLGPCFHRASVLLPLWNTLLPTGRFSTFRRNGVEWKRELAPAVWRAMRSLRNASVEMSGLNRKGARLAARAARDAPSPAVQADIAWLATSLSVGGRLAGCVAAYLAAFERAYRAASTGAGIEEAILDVNRLRRRLSRQSSAMRKHMPGAPLDYLGGDVGFSRNVVTDLQRQAGDMATTLTTGEWPPQPASTWW